MTRAYLAFAVVGAILPYLFFGNFMLTSGVNLTEFTRQLFATLPASGFTTDLLITSIVFWIWSFREAGRRGLRRWWVYPILNLTVGLSCALPLFLYFRQLRFEQPDAAVGGRSALPPGLTRV